MKQLMSLTLLAIIISMASCVKDIPIPYKPDNVKTSDEYALKVVISWDAVEHADSYNVYKAEYDNVSSPENLSYTLVGNTTKTTYDDLSVESSSMYFYKVKAVNETGVSSFSASVLGITVGITLDEAFNTLANYTNGKRYDAVFAADVPVVINEIIDIHVDENTDLVFLIDNTFSMSDDIGQVKSSSGNIINNLPYGVRLSMAVYNDFNEDPAGWYDWYDLTTNYSTGHSFLQNISVYGGGDPPESVYDGIFNTVDYMSWTQQNRMIIVIGDAPPLEGGLTQYSLLDVILKCQSMNTNVNLYPILIGVTPKSGLNSNE